MPPSVLEFEPEADALIAAAGAFCARGWCPATSANFSFRADAGLYITPSGVDKAQVHVTDLLYVGPDGVGPDGVGPEGVGPNGPSAGKPSAETPLHAMLYRTRADVGAVLHTHSVNAMVMSMSEATAGRAVWHGFEIAKAIRGHRSHDAVVELPIYPNDQDIPALARRIELALPARAPIFGFLLEGHGLYAWGADVAEARRHLEAYETLLACRTALRSLHGHR